MKKTALIFSFFLIVLAFFTLQQNICAQELRCNVIINADKVETQDRQVFTRLQKAVSDFINTTKWTNEQFLPGEQIVCNLVLTFDQLNERDKTDVQSGVYYAMAQITAVRPIYGTNFNSPVFTFIDRSFNFSYQISEPLIYIEGVTRTNLTLMLAYYANFILAMDFDSFGKMSGTPYTEKIINIQNNALSISGFESSGWQQGDVRNRSWLADNLNSPQMTEFREAMYSYHREGLDIMLLNPEKARENIFSALEKIKTVTNVKPNSVLISAFFTAKSDEIFNIFDKAPQELRFKAGNLLQSLDPVNAVKYEKLLRDGN
jgi:hypothetical protein